MSKLCSKNALEEYFAHKVLYKTIHYDTYINTKLKDVAEH